MVAANRTGSRRVEVLSLLRKREVARRAQHRVQVAMQMDDGGGARFLEQVIDVLGQQLDAFGSPFVLPFGEQLVRGVRFGVVLLANALVVKAEDRRAVLSPG